MPSLLGGDSREDRIRELVASVPLSPAEDVTAGPAAVSGTVEPVGETLAAPLTDVEGVVVEFEKGRNRDGDYEPVEGRIDAVPFLVRDDTGAVAVALGDRAYDDGPLPVSPARTDRFEGDEAGDNLREVDDEGPVLPWIHAQATVRPDDEVYVLGEAVPAGEAGVDGLPPEVEFVLTPGSAVDEFVLTDLSRTTLYQQLDRDSPIDGTFVRYALLGLIVVAIVAILMTIFVVTFVL